MRRVRQKASGAMWIAEKLSRNCLAINAPATDDVEGMIDRAKVKKAIMTGWLLL